MTNGNTFTGSQVHSQRLHGSCLEHKGNNAFSGMRSCARGLHTCVQGACTEVARLFARPAHLRAGAARRLHTCVQASCSDPAHHRAGDCTGPAHLRAGACTEVARLFARLHGGCTPACRVHTCVQSRLHTCVQRPSSCTPACRPCTQVCNPRAGLARRCATPVQALHAGVQPPCRPCTQVCSPRADIARRCAGPTRRCAGVQTALGFVLGIF